MSHLAKIDDMVMAPQNSPEEDAQNFFLKYRWKEYRRLCPRCGSKKVAEIRRSRLRCLSCRYEFGDFTGTYLGLLNISHEKWLALIKLFELGVPARQATRELGLSYPTVLKGFHIIRMAIAAQSDDFSFQNGEQLEEPSLENGFGNGNDHCEGSIFGFMEKAGRVRVDKLPEVGEEVLKSLKLRKIRRSSIAFTNKYQGYDRLIFYANGNLKGANSQPYQNWLANNGQEGFWSYAKRKLIRFHGISSQKFPLYLKELEFRYNHRKSDSSVTVLADYLTKPVAYLSLIALVDYLIKTLSHLL